jgi:hypothetical protein
MQKFRTSGEKKQSSIQHNDEKEIDGRVELHAKRFKKSTKIWSGRTSSTIVCITMFAEMVTSLKPDDDQREKREILAAGRLDEASEGREVRRRRFTRFNCLGIYKSNSSTYR